MGRSVYTPSTISWLASQAGSSQSNEHSAKTARQLRQFGENCTCSSIAALGCSCVDAAKNLDEMPPLRSERRHKSDAPYIWSQHRFDPDDESLPVVHETFIDGPVDEAEHVESLLDFIDDTSEPIEEDDEDSEAALELDEERQVEEGVANYTEEVTEEILDDDGSIWSLVRPNDANTSDGPQQGGFSPSAAVFHNHTLPFFLPAVGSMQRRASSEHAVTPSTGPIASEA